MSAKWKILLATLACLLAITVIEQLNLENLYFSGSMAETRTADTVKPPTSDPISTVRVERPITRWLPLAKFGETVHFHTYQRRGSDKAIREHTATVRTKLWVIGLCSTAKYDEMANRLSEKIGKEYQQLR
jgi:hypothetical protein